MIILFVFQIDLWAIGCILYELLTLEPLFHCKQDDIKASSPFNRDALEKIFQVLGYPSGIDQSETRRTVPRVSEINEKQTSTFFN
jgi:serine/threonine protein kinase